MRAPLSLRTASALSRRCGSMCGASLSQLSSPGSTVSAVPTTIAATPAVAGFASSGGPRLSSADASTADAAVPAVVTSAASSRSA